MSGEHDDFRQEVYEREGLLTSLRALGGVDLDIKRGAGFDAPSRVARRAHTGGGSGQYIGSSEAYWQLDGRKR